ncbi:MAG: TraR/DksA family transcriptional regulator [Bdellovibrionota bacterium]
MQQIREALLARWQQLGTGLEREKEATEALSNTSQAEMIDIAQSLEQIGRDTSLAEQERRELVAIERALAKMATGAFGVCEDCGEEIPHKRLMVLPEARLCANCQTFEERQNSRVRPSAVAR